MKLREIRELGPRWQNWISGLTPVKRLTLFSSLVLGFASVGTYYEFQYFPEYTPYTGGLLMVLFIYIAYKFWKA